MDNTAWSDDGDLRLPGQAFFQRGKARFGPGFFHQLTPCRIRLHDSQWADTERLQVFEVPLANRAAAYHKGFYGFHRMS